jgi:hypothetical protein
MDEIKNSETQGGKGRRRGQPPKGKTTTFGFDSKARRLREKVRTAKQVEYRDRISGRFEAGLMQGEKFNFKKLEKELPEEIIAKLWHEDHDLEWSGDSEIPFTPEQVRQLLESGHLPRDMSKEDVVQLVADAEEIPYED